MESFGQYKQTIVGNCRTLVANGYLKATGGNVSLRLPGGAGFAITPSNYDYLKMAVEDVCVLDFDLNSVQGERKPSIESGMHAGIYSVRPDVHAIIHTHQEFASALALINAPIPALFDEQVRFLGRSVDIIPYAPSGTWFLEKQIQRHMRNGHNAYILQNHGALCFGHDPERAMHNVEILEKSSVAYLLALCTERKVSKIPLLVREIAFAKLRADQKVAARGDKPTSGE
jgi:ribulose-5-phosphate 4-epimerase/fuculose-1-phosphate aldolase